jgi:hypothetical protein
VGTFRRFIRDRPSGGVRRADASRVGVFAMKIQGIAFQVLGSVRGGLPIGSSDRRGKSPNRGVIGVLRYRRGRAPTRINSETREFPLPNYSFFKSGEGSRTHPAVHEGAYPGPARPESPVQRAYADATSATLRIRAWPSARIGPSTRHVLETSGFHPDRVAIRMTSRSYRRTSTTDTIGHHRYVVGGETTLDGRTDISWSSRSR